MATLHAWPRIRGDRSKEMDAQTDRRRLKGRFDECLELPGEAFRPDSTLLLGPRGS